MRSTLALAVLAASLALGGCAPLTPAAGAQSQPSPTPAATTPGVSPTATGATAPVTAGGSAPSVGAGAAAPAVAQAQLPPAPPPDLPPPPPGYPPVYAVESGLTARGEAVVRVEPDVAFISTGVLTRGQTAQAAQDENTRLMTAVIQAIRAAGVAGQDVRTSGVALHPVYDREPNAITGYQAVNTLRITVQDVAQTGAILDATVTAGANLASNIQFGLKDDSTPRRQALGEAVKAARADADAMAAAAGVRIVGVQSLVDESASGPTSPEVGRVAMAAPASAGAVPVQPGQLAVTARVRVIYGFQ